MYSWYQNIFHVLAVLIVFHAANKKNRTKTILKQDSNSIQRRGIVPVSKMKARKIKTFLPLPIHLDRHPIAAAAVAPLSRRCPTAVAPLSLLLLCCRFCCSCCYNGITAAIASAVTQGCCLKRHNQGNGFHR